MKDVSDATVIGIGHDGEDERGFKVTGYSVADLRGRLVGATVVDVQVEADEFGMKPWPYILVRTKTGEQVALGIGHDEEGNGGGFIHLGEYEEVSTIRGGEDDD